MSTYSDGAGVSPATALERNRDEYLQETAPYSRTKPVEPEWPKELKSIDVKKATAANLKSCKRPDMPIKEIRNLLFGLFRQSKAMRDQLTRWFHERTGDHRYEYKIVTVISDTEVCIMKFDFNKGECAADRVASSGMRLSAMYTFCRRSPAKAASKKDN